MVSDSNDSGGPRTEGVAHHDRPDISQLIYYLGSATGDWKDSYYNVSPEILGRVIRLLYRTYLDDNGQPCGLLIEIVEEACPPKGEGHPRLSHRDDDNGRMERVHE